MIVSSATSKSSLITENCFGTPFEILVSLKSRLRKCTEVKKSIASSVHSKRLFGRSDNRTS